jgi:glutaminyl-tRNA synthetase
MVADTTIAEAGRDFVREIVAEDLASGKHKGVVTRFPPEPNGYLHIGHAKSICLNFGIAQEFGGRCHLRFDDTNPAKEEQEFIDAIQRDVRWLGFDWDGHLYHASDYFEQLYQWAEHLIRDGKAYVDDQSAEEIRAMRGTLTEPGRNSPFRDRPVEENLELLRRMRAGEFPDGARVLRAKIDMASGNINLRDPVLYRILHASHPRTKTAWCIYPTYDFAHGQSDAIEHITHSLCTLEFEDHRPLYDWFLDNLPVPSRPRQYEFARLNITHTVLSKRVLTELVRGGHVSGWDDPRMPTIAGLRRRGVPPEAIRDFVRRVGVARANSTVEFAMFDASVREFLNKTAPRRMAVLRPLKIVIENWPEGKVEELDAINNPEDPSAGTRRVKFGREIYVERDDFMENPPKKFYRLAPGREVRLRYAYFVTCREAVKDADGEVTELRCTYDPATRGGDAPDGRKVQATLHWVAAADAVKAEVRLYNQLFADPEPDVANGLAKAINPDSLERVTGALVEPALVASNAEGAVQFERQGYFCLDPDSKPGAPVFNRTVGLRDSWAKVKAKGG